MLRWLIYLLFIAGFSACTRQAETLVVSDNPDFVKAYALRDSGLTDSSFFYFSKARLYFMERGDTTNLAKCLVNMAIIANDHGDYFGGQELSLNALPLLDSTQEQHRRILRSNYNNLSLACHRLKEFARAIEYAQKALLYTSDSASRRIILNNMALTYHNSKEFKKAISIYKKVSGEETDPVNLARVLANMANARSLSDPQYNPVSQLLKSLAIRKQHNDLLGQAASYCYLSEYYMAYKRDSALYFANKMLRAAGMAQSPDDRLSAIALIIKSGGGGNSSNTFAEYERLQDSIQASRTAASNQFALIRYETEKYRAESIRQTEISLKRARWIMSLIALTISGSIGGFFWYRKRQQAMELKSANAIKESQLKTSKKVHDVVANGLYRLMSRVDSDDYSSDEELLDDIEVLYEKSRDISYDVPEVKSYNENFVDDVTKLLGSFEAPGIKILQFGNVEMFWEDVPPASRTEYRLVLQELLVNMKKHSGASQVAFRFERNDDQLSIHYLDNGTGIDPHSSPGNGISNMVQRMEKVGATIVFERANNGGLRVQIDIKKADV